MKKPVPAGDDIAQGDPVPRKRRTGLLLLAAIVPVTLAGAGAAYVFVPYVSAAVSHLLGSRAAVEVAPSPSPVAVVVRPQFVELAEMTVTMPNGGRTRQMKIRLALELAPRTSPAPPDVLPVEVLSPRVYDAILTYLRTLRDVDTEGGLALDRMRGDLYRRLTLVLGPDVLQDVLITSLIIA